MIKDEILKKIDEYDTIVIYGHKRPDGDCYGSQMGLKSIIKNNFKDKKVYIVGENVKYLSFLGEMDIIDDDICSNSLAIVVDTPIPDRVSDNRFSKAREIIKIDHHFTEEEFGSLSWIDSNCPACSQIIASLLLSDNMTIDYEGALALYVGIISDTGRFKYKGVDANTLLVSSKLLEYGVDVTYIDKHLSIETLDVIKLKGYILSNFQITENGFIYAVLNRETIEKYNVTNDQAASMVNQISTIEGCPVWALIIEYENQIRIRLRSRGPRIDLLANKYNGGGHQMASGAGIDSFNDLSNFVFDANQLVKEYKDKE